MSNNKTFVEQCLNGLVDVDDIDEFVEKWHLSDSDEEIWDFLGLTNAEYALWIEKPMMLHYILLSKKHNIPLNAAMKLGKDEPIAFGN